MKDLIIRLWPAEAMPSSHFRLVKQLVELHKVAKQAMKGLIVRLRLLRLGAAAGGCVPVG